MGELMEYRHVMKCSNYQNLYTKYYCKDLGQFDQGIPGLVNSTNAIFFIDKTDIPTERWKDATYDHVVVNYHAEKGDLYSTRLIVGENLIVYPGDCGTPTIDLLTIKFLLNSVISTPDAKFMTIDIHYFYLNTPMLQFKYMNLKLSNLPQGFVKLYNLASKVDKHGFVYLKIRRGMYGLPQAGILSSSPRDIINSKIQNRPSPKKTMLIFTHSKGVFDLTIGIDIQMNLQTHQRASVRARAYAHGDYTSCPPIRDIRDTAYCRLAN